ncbi:hypothetical protein [Flagellimonas meridianipacifica]|uniref:DUF3299 domain-containing protein n=1 Tax=Flagellimonas meridianipacifica TaxID=1080225 RepID=A0A2T0MIQ7_9FLAO|nr:hypothetical protein [Allomuricauda pacifica]PRX57467.1 hypothetical protein CLV81_1472 [Allomuricauda pacifica]
MRVFAVIVFFLMAAEGRTQTTLTWEDLSDGIFWESHTPNALIPGFEKATFSARLRALEGKKISITGYLLVLDGKQSIYLLSKNPMASCFFCGNGGPESIVDLQFDKKVSYGMDALLSVEGTFHLNGNDPNASYYRIENANAVSFK